jgi:hypothetical protein
VTGSRPSLQVYYKDASNNPDPKSEKIDNSEYRNYNITEAVTETIVSYHLESNRVWIDGD